VAGWFARSGHEALATVLAAAPAALIVVSYAAASRRDVDATTEVAAFVALGAGLLAGLGYTVLASGIVAVTVLLLVEKSALHRLVERIDDEELRAAARFGVMAVVILPLLPEGPFGPLGGVKPRELWLLVLFFAGLSFVGYFARRMVGAAHGYPLAGALAGLISSTNATFTFARLSRAASVPSGTLATGAIAACTVLFPRVLLATTVLDHRVAVALLPYVVPPFVLGLGIVTVWLRRSPGATSGGEDTTNPLQIGPALQMAVVFQVVLFVVAVVRTWFGAGGLLATGAVLGLTDMDALTISMSKAAASGLDPQVAAQAIAIGIVANSAMKAGIAAALGTREFAARTGGALAVMAAALAGAFVFAW
jgi:uncharacterized membrane protein (DUF4010 family)